MGQAGDRGLQQGRRTEVLAPAGTQEALEAAVSAGADAIYFGVHGFNARDRAKNFTLAGLSATFDHLHRHGVKGYITLNTLVFEEEWPRFEETVRAVAAAGADAVIVQDLGVARLVREIAPTLPIHASTQMTCTDAGSVQFARSLGASRVVLARELSVEEIGAIAAAVPEVEYEIFVHGALCVAYSGQCLTSEAIGGRSANRGACAQACRLPYELVVDGEIQPLGDRAYLLSPQDLFAVDAVEALVAHGVSSLKIEGRLKGPEYVAATTRLYRQSVAAAYGEGDAPSETARERALATYTRGSGLGFLHGINHQTLVEARHCDHRGLAAGTFEEVVARGRKRLLRVTFTHAVGRGDGLLIEGGFAGAGEVGGRIWFVEQAGVDHPEIAGGEALVWLGPDVEIPEIPAGRRAFLTALPKAKDDVRTENEGNAAREPLTLLVEGEEGAPLTVHARTDDGRIATATSTMPLARAATKGLDDALLRDKLGGFGDTSYRLHSLVVNLSNTGLFVPVGELKRLRRALTEALDRGAERSHSTTDATAASVLANLRPALPGTSGDDGDGKPGLWVLARNEAQALAAIEAGAAGIYLDLLELTGTGPLLRKLQHARDSRGGSMPIALAPPRIRKPGEEKIDKYLEDLKADGYLVRGLGALYELGSSPRTDANKSLRIGDFSLNVANRIAAYEVLSRGLDAFVPSFDLDEEQLPALLDDPELARRAEVVLHHPMPLFHNEHCLFAALLSEGKDHRTCGRPCDHHTLALKDRAGMEHPVAADVGCRNTVFHGKSQSAAPLAAKLLARGVTRFRIELVREDAAQVKQLLASYTRLLNGEADATTVLRELRTEGGYGVVRGSLRVLR